MLKRIELNFRNSGVLLSYKNGRNYFFRYSNFIFFVRALVFSYLVVVRNPSVSTDNASHVRNSSLSFHLNALPIHAWLGVGTSLTKCINVNKIFLTTVLQPLFLTIFKTLCFLLKKWWLVLCYRPFAFSLRKVRTFIQWEMLLGVCIISWLSQIFRFYFCLTDREVNGYVMSLRSSFYGKVIANRSHMKKETGSIRRDPFVAASVVCDYTVKTFYVWFISSLLI